MVQGLGAPTGPTTLAALLVRPGLPGTPPDPAAATDPQTRAPPDQVTFSVEARQRAELAKQAVATLEASGAWSSAAAFGWLLHQRLLALSAARAGRTAGPDPPPPAAPRGGVVDLAV